MTIDYRIRNIVIAAVLAAAAVLLTVVYVTSAQDDAAAGKETVTVYVPAKDYAIGTAGSKIAGNLDKQTIARKYAAPEAVTNPAQIKGLYLTQPVYTGEQLTLNRFALPKQQGVRAELKGNQRAHAGARYRRSGARGHLARRRPRRRRREPEGPGEHTAS